MFFCLLGVFWLVGFWFGLLLFWGFVCLFLIWGFLWLFVCFFVCFSIYFARIRLSYSGATKKKGCQMKQSLELNCLEKSSGKLENKLQCKRTTKGSTRIFARLFSQLPWVTCTLFKGNKDQASFFELNQQTSTRKTAFSSCLADEFYPKKDFCQPREWWTATAADLGG